MAINPLREFAKFAGDPRKSVYIYDVDLALQPSMGTITTTKQRKAMEELYNITEGGVLIFTGRTPQSSNITFGHDYPGVFEHYSIARFGLGQSFVFMAPKIDIPKLSGLTADAIKEDGKLRLVETPAEIGKSSDPAVFIEKKNASIALVHTTLKPKFDGDPAPLAHLEAIRESLVPVAKKVIEQMGLTETHKYKQGNDAVEIVPKGVDKDTEAKIILGDAEMDRINQHGLSKATALHNFHPLFNDRVFHMLGDGEPDLEVVVEIKKHYRGMGTYVSNGIPLMEKFAGFAADNKTPLVDHIIGHHEMSWPMVIDLTDTLKDKMPKAKLPLPKAGGMVPNLKNLG